MTAPSMYVWWFPSKNFNLFQLEVLSTKFWEKWIFSLIFNCNHNFFTIHLLNSDCVLLKIEGVGKTVLFQILKLATSWSLSVSGHNFVFMEQKLCWQKPYCFVYLLWISSSFKLVLFFHENVSFAFDFYLILIQTR